MILLRVLSVLFISISLSACGSQASSDMPFATRTYLLKEVSLGDGSILFRVEDGGRNFWVPIGRISVGVVNPDLSGTHLWVRAARGAFDEVDLSHVYNVTVLTRTGEQQQKWMDFIKVQKDILYGPNDVLPPALPNLSSSSDRPSR